MNITEEKLLEYLSKALVCVAVIVIEIGRAHV